MARGRSWSAGEDQQLAELRALGYPPAEVARQIGRSRQAVNTRAHQLRLPRPHLMRRADVGARFWAKVDRRDDRGCWLWTGARFWNGYGSFAMDGRSVKAHRFAYELLAGPIPEGMHLMHSCDTPACVNPTHLTPATRQENTDDMVRKRRHAHGERHLKAKLSIEQVRQIRRRLDAGESQSALARAYGVATVTVHWIAAGKTWREVRA